MRVRIVLACLVVGAVYAQHEPRKCQQGLPMCKFLRCLSTEYEGTATDHVATTLRNISCNGELLLPIVKYEKLWNGWTDNDNRDLFKACGFEAPKNSTECRPMSRSSRVSSNLRLLSTAWTMLASRIPVC
ncbi:unnamed protein product, partial [Mesorhabditis spiculigera]